MKNWLFTLLLPILVDAKPIMHQDILDQEIDAYFAAPNAYYEFPVRKLHRQDHLNVSAESKLKWRENYILNSTATTKSEPRRNDLVENLLRGYPIEKNIQTLSQSGLESGRVKVQPWSDDYWPIYKGILSARYADEDYEYFSMWEEANNYVMDNTAKSIFETGDIERINKLSPSEKFDLLLSGSDHRLTANMWAQGRRYFEASNDGHIETWMGICHGWAPASYMVDRPKHAIEVTAFDGKTKIKFYPSDLKALASLLWASTDFQTNFIGGRCSLKDPDSDDNDRPYNNDCQDNNPASFHLALTNGIGALGKSFVMDVTYDYEVWNQPVVSYGYKYFNPNNRRERGELASSIIKLSEFENDPFKKFRSKKAKYLVGIALEVVYGVETRPIQRESESERNDQMNSAFYLYDLELDENYNIIGGEWYNRQHPDFLWTPDYQTQALTSADYYLLSKELWNGDQALEENIKSLGQRAGSSGSPLAYLVKSLIQLAQ